MNIKRPSSSVRSITKLTAAALAALFLTAAVAATTRHVPSQYPTIQDAINAAAPGDTVLVADGTYSGAGNTDVDFLGKAIEVRSANGPAVCIIDCGGSSRAFNFVTGEGSNSILRGFTIRDGDVSGVWPGGDGGAILIESAGPRIVNCWFRANVAEGGGAIAAFDGSARIENCAFNVNNALSGWGGAIHSYGGHITVRDSSFNDNTSVDAGGAVAITTGAASITDCTFEGNDNNGVGGAVSAMFGVRARISASTFKNNESGMGGAIFLRGDTVVDVNECAFEENDASNVGGAIACMYPYADTPAILNVRNSSFVANRATNGGAIATQYYGQAVIAKSYFNANTARAAGGAIWNGAGSFYNDDPLGCTRMFIANCRFFSNTADLGGAVATQGDEWLGDSLTTIVNAVACGNVARRGGVVFTDIGHSRIVNCSFSRNLAAAGGAAYNTATGAATIANAILWNNTGCELSGPNFAVTFSNVTGGYPGIGNINANPMFLDPATCNLRLNPLSPCIDQGNNAALPADCADLDDDGNTAEPTPVDLDMQPRIHNFRVDMGAYEYQGN